jgi:PTH1 family peptidyl-tRNA hydrolase
LNLPTGKIRIRAKGSHGGNNGLRDIQSYIGEQYSRLKMGVGNPRKGDATSHVLGKFSPSERPAIADSIILAGQAVQVWLNSGINVVMNQFNSGSDGKD